MMPKRFWRDMPTTAFGDAARDWIAVLPVAAIEQHGPHLPVGVDAFIAEGMVAACAKALPQTSSVTFLPIQQICKSDEHLAFPGTLTVGWEEVAKTWIAIGESVHRAGLTKLVIVTSHGGNAATMDIAARELRVRLGMTVVTTSWGRLGRWQEIYNYAPGPMIDIHGGLSETSLMLALRPDLVEMDKAQDFVSTQTDMATQNDKLGLHGSAANIAWMAQDLNLAGPVGDASAANANAGQRDIDAVVEGFVTLMQELAAYRSDSFPVDEG